jgi:hypothetical protein
VKKVPKVGAAAAAAALWFSKHLPQQYQQQQQQLEGRKRQGRLLRPLPLLLHLSHLVPLPRHHPYHHPCSKVQAGLPLL